MKRPQHLRLLVFLAAAACGDSDASSEPEDAGVVDSGGGGGTPDTGVPSSDLEAGTGRFLATNLNTMDTVSELTQGPAELSYTFRDMGRTLLIVVGSGDNRVGLQVVDDTAFAQRLPPGTYDVLGDDTLSSGVRGATDVVAFLNGAEYRVESGDGFLSIDAHDTLRISGRLEAKMIRLTQSEPSVELSLEFDAAVELPEIDPAIAEGTGSILFGMSTTPVVGVATARESDGQLVIQIADAADENWLEASMPNVEGVLAPGLRGGGDMRVEGLTTRSMNRTTEWDGNSNSRVAMGSVTNGVLEGRIDFNGDARSSGSRSSATSRGQFRVVLP